ncbi:hypothetical protein D9M71_527940 [compost metagenome]
MLTQVLGALGALQAGVAVGIEPVGQGIDQAFGRHVIAQQVTQLALGAFAVGAEQCIDVEAGVLVAYPQLRLASAKIVVQRLPAQGLPEQRTEPPGGVPQGLPGIGQAGLLHGPHLHSLVQQAHFVDLTPAIFHQPGHARRQHCQHHHHHQQGRTLLLPSTHWCVPRSRNKNASQHAGCFR